MTVDHVGLAVAHLEAMAQWYAQVLDAVVDYRAERPGIAVQVIVLIDADGFRLELLHREGSAPAHGREDIATSLLRHGLGHLALRVDDVQVAFERLVGLGAAAVSQPGPGSQPGMMIAFVADPEENLVELVSRRPSQ
jgi:catechol 2,3-dioxygenase-like lactoylglutathione lyase family enzyme